MGGVSQPATLLIYNNREISLSFQALMQRETPVHTYTRTHSHARARTG